MPTIALVAGGFVAGMFFLPLLLRWFGLIYTSITPQEGAFLGPPKRRLLWVSPFLFLVHPAPYLIVALIAVSLLTVLGRMPAPWTWLLLGFYSYAAFLSFVIVVNMTRVRRARVKAGRPNQRLERP
jgi:hypothetical protein